MLSNIAHGGLASVITRFDLDKKSKALAPVFGCVYAEQRAGLVLAYFDIALHGLINVALELDPEARNRDGGAHAATIDAGLSYLNRSLDEDWRTVPSKRGLLRAAAPLIGWTPPEEA